MSKTAATTVGGATNPACVGSSGNVFGYPGPSLAVSQYSGGAILWALDNSKFDPINGAPPVLYAYDASNIAATPLFSGSAGTGKSVKFLVPTVVNGHVYVGTSNQLVVFH